MLCDRILTYKIYRSHVEVNLQIAHK